LAGPVRAAIIDNNDFFILICLLKAWFDAGSNIYSWQGPLSRTEEDS
jgi:hypothetical protein